MYSRRHISNFIVIRRMGFEKYSVPFWYLTQNEEIEKNQNKDFECISLALESKILIKSTFLFVCLCDCNSYLHQAMTHIGINSLITVTLTAYITDKFIPHSHIWIYSWKILVTKSPNAAMWSISSIFFRCLQVPMTYNLAKVKYNAFIVSFIVFISVWRIMNFDPPWRKNETTFQKSGLTRCNKSIQEDMCQIS